jgi:hypothetical protein
MLPKEMTGTYSTGLSESYFQKIYAKEKMDTANEHCVSLPKTKSGCEAAKSA